MILSVLSFLPFILFLLLLIWKKMPLLKVSFITLAVVAASSLFCWKIYPVFLISSFAKGLEVAFDIFIVIFGAIFFLEVIKEEKIIENLCLYLESFSNDYRVTVIILAWFLENFLEGTAGFGTPGAVVAPILMGMGLSPLKAVIIALLGNSTAGVFGAAGTPIRVGFAGLNVNNVPFYAGLLNTVGVLVPVFMIWTLSSGKEDKKNHFMGALPFAIWSGLLFVAASFLILPLGQEFPSILGSVLSLGIVYFTLRLKIFVPKTTITLKENNSQKPNLPFFKVMFPYLILIIILIAGKFFFGSSKLFSPGFAFFFSALLAAVLWKNKPAVIFQKASISFKKALHPFWVIACMSVMVQLMINNGHNYSGLPSLMGYFGSFLKTTFLPFVAPFAGAFGSFLTGSVTISNLMFGQLFADTALKLNLNIGKILALLITGAAAGNMVALADILAAETVVGLKNEERHILKGVLLPCLIYLVLIGLVGLFIGNFPK